MNEPVTERDSTAGERVAWVLVGALATIALSLFVLDGAAQSTAITGALIAALVGIAWIQRRSRNR